MRGPGMMSRQMMCTLFLASALMLSSPSLEASDGDRVDLTFDLTMWSKRDFDGQTVYDVGPGQAGVICAQADAAASMLFRQLKVDLAATPFLNWRWRIEGTMDISDQRHKRGDDFPARVYVLAQGWRTRALSLVWSNVENRGEAWPNPFTRSVQMVALRGGSKQAGVWVNQKVNVIELFAEHFDTRITSLAGVGIMTDSDNSGSAASACYADLHFSAH